MEHAIEFEKELSEFLDASISKLNLSYRTLHYVLLQRAMGYYLKDISQNEIDTKRRNDNANQNIKAAIPGS